MRMNIFFPIHTEVMKEVRSYIFIYSKMLIFKLNLYYSLDIIKHCINVQLYTYTSPRR